jgi:ATP-dependent helicase Lhr and Lhr-like helicase
MKTAFDKLATPVQKWIRDQGFRELRDIQTRTIHAIYDQRDDLIVAASTAGGKTEAAFLPLISQVIDSPAQGAGFDILYIGPLKALISDQAQRLSAICHEAELPVVPWHGDIAASVKSKALKVPKGILLITPESLEALFMRRGLEIPRLFQKTRAIVIDELHSFLDSERGIQMRSLITRLEISTRRQLRRVGLSATLGDMDLARSYLRPDNPSSVNVIESKGGSAELQLQVRGYQSGSGTESESSATKSVVDHLFKHLRGSDNLVFAGSRNSVEFYADALRNLCEGEQLPQEFYPHHASLSRDHREFVEKRLKAVHEPTTAICTSTLELGIDIGDVACVAQISAPYSVASLRQRLGRSGRRAGKPAVLRQYAIEAKLEVKSNFSDRLRLSFMRAVAMIELLLESWCEPPQKEALRLSTLVHQILSVVAERGGIHAQILFKLLCIDGPFRRVTPLMFADVLRAIGRTDIALIEQAQDGLLLLGQTGEKLTEHYSFYAVFQTPEEYRLLFDGKELGALPIDNVVSPGSLLIFSGRRWQVVEVDARSKVIIVKPAKAGIPPKFGGDPGNIHDRVIGKMFELFENEIVPVYLDKEAVSLLSEARENYCLLSLQSRRIVHVGSDELILATRCGTVKTTTLALALRSKGFTVHTHDGFLEVLDVPDGLTLHSTLENFTRSEKLDLFAHSPLLVFEKFHPYLTNDLLEIDAMSQRVDVGSVTPLCGELLGRPTT